MTVQLPYMNRILFPNMNVVSSRLVQFAAHARVGLVGAVCAFALCLTTPHAQATPKAANVSGNVTTTITNLVYNADGTLSITATQSGHLTTFGNFTGTFSYVATPFSDGYVLRGTAVLINNAGDRLNIVATMVDVGTDYPLSLGGELHVTGGTGRYVGAGGLIAISGTDGASLTDTFRLDGVLTTP